MSTLTIQLFDTSRVILTNEIESPSDEERTIPFTNSPLDNFRGSNQNLAVLVGDGSPNAKEGTKKVQPCK
jgi:hypothetical protein